MAKDYEIEWYGKQFMVKASRVNRQTLSKAAIMVESYIKHHFTLQGTHRAYKRGRKLHISSAPGRPPAIDTGALRSSVTHEVNASGLDAKVGSDKDRLKRQTVGTDVDYGYYLEMGTRRMKPRPWLRPALNACRSKINRMFQDANRAN